IFSHPPATPQLSPLSLHDALPICLDGVRNLPLHEGRTRTTRFWKPSCPHPIPIHTWLREQLYCDHPSRLCRLFLRNVPVHTQARSEEHTSELQSRENLVCRLLLEK